MENFVEDIILKLGLSYLFSFVTYLMVIIASMILYRKRPSQNTLILLIGSILMTIGYLASFILIPIISQGYGMEMLRKFQIINSFFKSISFFVFILGLLLFVTNNLEKE